MAQLFFKVNWNEGSGKDISSRVFFDQNEAKDFADSLAIVFSEQGFVRFELRQLHVQDTLILKFDSGNRHVWKELSQGNVPDNWWKIMGKPGKKFSEPYLWMEKLIRFSEDSGYPFASVRIDSLQIKGTGLFGVFRYEEGPRIIWDSLEVSGETKTAKKFLQHYSGIVPGSFFSQNQFDRAAGKMNHSPYFKLDSIPQITFQIKSAIPKFRLTDRKINVFDGIIGLIPNQNQANSILVTGELNLGLYHLGGKGRDISVHWLKPNIQSQNLEFAAKESYLFGSPLNLQLDFTLLRQDSSFINRQFKLQLDYSISKAGSLRFFSKRKAGDVIDFSGEIGISPSLMDFRWNSYGFGVVWDKLDDPIFPRKGLKVDGEFSLGNKRLLDNMGIPSGVNQQFRRTSTQWHGSVTIEDYVLARDYWGIFLRFKTGVLGNDNLFLNEFFRFGGLKSLRGFNEMFFFADRFAFFNFEHRVYFGKESYLMAFGDIGWLNNPYLNPKIDRPKSFGLGMNLDTDEGLFSFVVGLGRSNIQPISLSYARIHFGYLARF